MTNGPRRRTWTLRGPLMIGCLALAGLLAGVALWGAKAPIAGAIIGTGKVEVAADLTVVQHPVGGVVAEVLVHDGDEVVAGDVLLRLDDKTLRSDLAAVEGELYETLANLARLEAIIDDQRAIRIPQALAEAATLRPEIEALVQRQQQRLDRHFTSVATERELIEEQIRQVDDQIEGIDAELSAKLGRAEVLTREIADQEDLASRGLAVIANLYALQKDQLTNEGEAGQLRARAAELQGRIAELRLKSHALLPDLQAEADVEASRLRPERTALQERRRQLLADLARTEVRAPVTGRIHDSRVQGMQSVVVAAAPLMAIVPSGHPLTVLVRVDVGDIEQVHPGQPAFLKFTGFGGRRIPNINGHVEAISPDAFVDAATRAAYYEVRLQLSASEISRLGTDELLPGMPVTAFMATETRTPISYLARPILFYFDRAFRDS